MNTSGQDPRSTRAARCRARQGWPAGLAEDFHAAARATLHVASAGMAAHIRHARGRALAPSTPTRRMDAPGRDGRDGLAGRLAVTFGAEKSLKSPMDAPRRDRFTPLATAGPDAGAFGLTLENGPAGDDRRRAV